MENERKFFERLVSVFIGIVLLILIGFALSSCNVTRTVTTTVIMTKTIESYDGKVDASKLLQAGQAASGL